MLFLSLYSLDDLHDVLVVENVLLAHLLRLMLDWRMKKKDIEILDQFSMRQCSRLARQDEIRTTSGSKMTENAAVRPKLDPEFCSGPKFEPVVISILSFFA